MNTELNHCPLKSEQTIELLLDYTARRLSPAQASLLERHMAGCADCAAFRDDQAAVWHALEAWQPAPVSVDFNRRLWRRIDEEKALPWYTKAGLRALISQLRASAWKPAFSLVAAVLVVATGFLLDHPASRTAAQGVPDESRVTVSEADQVERTLDDIQLLHQFDAAAMDGEPSSREPSSRKM